LNKAVSAFVLVILIVVAALGAVALLSHSTPGLSTTSSSSSSAACTILGQPAGFYLRVLNVSTGAPVRGADVVAVNEPAYCNYQQAAPRTTVAFTTNGTEWFELPSENDAGYAISVAYAGQPHNFTADLNPVSLTCATIYLPTGATNVTIKEFGGACSAAASPLFLSSAANANVTLDGYPGEIVVDANASRIYVVDLFANELTVIDATTFAAVATITLPGTAQPGMAVDQETGMIYIPVGGCTNTLSAKNSCNSATAQEKGGIVVVDGSTDTIAGEFAVDAEELAVNPATDILYGLATYPILSSNANGYGYLLAVDAATGSVVANTSLGTNPFSLAVDTKTDTIFVAGCEQVALACLGAEILGVDGATYRVLTVTPLDFYALNFNIVLDQSRDTVYALGGGGSNMSLVSVDGLSGQVRYDSLLGGSCAEAGGGAVALNTASDQVYASFASQQFLLFIDASTGKIVNMINATAGAQSVAFNPSTGAIYLTLEAPDEKVGYLVSLPSAQSQSYADASLLPQGICLP